VPRRCAPTPASSWRRSFFFFQQKTAYELRVQTCALPISSLLIKPASAVCNLDCAYCFYLDREADPYKALPARRMTEETLERLVEIGRASCREGGWRGGGDGGEHRYAGATERRLMAIPRST